MAFNLPIFNILTTGKVYWYQHTGTEHWEKYEIAADVYRQLGLLPPMSTMTAYLIW